MLLRLDRVPGGAEMEFPVKKHGVSQMEGFAGVGRKVDRAAGDRHAEHGMAFRLERFDDVSSDLARIGIRCHGVLPGGVHRREHIPCHVLPSERGGILGVQIQEGGRRRNSADRIAGFRQGEKRGYPWSGRLYFFSLSLSVERFIPRAFAA